MTANQKLCASADAVLLQKRTRQRFGHGYVSYPHPDLTECAELLAEAYLAEHAPDDDAPVTTAALVSMGGSTGPDVGDGVLFGSWSYGLFFVVGEGAYCRLEQGNDSILVPPPRDLGHARRLLKALSLLPEKA